MPLCEGQTIHHILNEAEGQVADIARMLRTIRDAVAPMIPERDLARVSIRQSVRQRIAPHPALRRAGFAAEAAIAALGRIRDCSRSVRTILANEDAAVSPDIRRAEASYWQDRASELGQTVARAWAAVAQEQERALSGKATLAEGMLPCVAESIGA